MGPALSYRPREHIVNANSICIGMKLNYTSVKLQSKKTPKWSFIFSHPDRPMARNPSYQNNAHFTWVKNPT
jgi:hypothetical protein